MDSESPVSVLRAMICCLIQPVFPVAIPVCRVFRHEPVPKHRNLSSTIDKRRYTGGLAAGSHCDRATFRCSGTPCTAVEQAVYCRTIYVGLRGIYYLLARYIPSDLPEVVPNLLLRHLAYPLEIR